MSDETWHVICGLAVSVGMPIFASLVIAGELTGRETFWWFAIGVFVVVLPFEIGLELIARSIVDLERGSLRGWKAEFDLASKRVELLGGRALRPSLDSVGMNPSFVLSARRATWVGAAAVVVYAIATATG